jgi:hypothetical protein
MALLIRGRAQLRADHNVEKAHSRGVSCWFIRWCGGGFVKPAAAEVTFEYGALSVQYQQQDASGTPAPSEEDMWCRILGFCY